MLMSTLKMDNLTMNELSEESLQQVVGGELTRLPSTIWPRHETPSPPPEGKSSIGKSFLKGVGGFATRGTLGYAVITTVGGFTHH
jgi:bacteriocin-like protein